MKEAVPPPFAGCIAIHPGARRDCLRVLVGLPDDSQSSYRRGPAGAPARIREIYNGDAYNATTELGVDLTAAVHDAGDLPPGADWAATASSYETAIRAFLNERKVPFCMGGDHAVTVPVVAALAQLEEPVHVVQIDAHADLYPSFSGSRTSHACVASRILEMDHVAGLVQIGIRTLNAEQREVAERHGGRVTLVEARRCHPSVPDLPQLRGRRVYVTLDLDGLDPAHAPGVSHPVPGGLSPRQVLALLQRPGWDLVGMDVVELNPDRDVQDLTASLAGRLLHEGMGRALGKGKS